MHLLATVITNLDNPIHILEATESQSFFNENIGTDVLKVSKVINERFSKFQAI